MKSKYKNILVLASTFPINEQDEVPSFVKDLIVSLKIHDSDISFTVISASYGENQPEAHDKFKQLRYRYFIKRFENLTKRGILPTVKKNILYFFVIPFFIVFQIIFTIKSIKKIKPDLVYAHWVMPQGLTAIIIKKIFKIPYVFTTHANDAEILGKIPYLGKKILNSIVANSESFTSVSNNTEVKLKKFIKQSNWNESKSLVFPMPIKNNIFEESEESKINGIVKNEKIKFTYIGRFAEKKGVEKLITSFSEILKKKNNVELIICGSGYLKNDYENLIKSLNIQESVTISEGFLNPSELKFVYNVSNFIVIPSVVTKKGDVEGLPVVLLESLYFGKVIIASTESNAQEIITHKEDGFIFSSNIEKDLERLMKEIVEEKYDLKEIEVKARKKGGEYISENTAKIYYEHLFC